jgi:MFS family permease
MLSGAARNKRFVLFSVFAMTWFFSLNLSVPFYLVYIRTSLGMSNTAIVLIAQILPNICSVIMLSIWGRTYDNRGSKHTMTRIGRLSCIAPLLWFFVTHNALSFVFIIITYISTGLLAPGMELCAQSAVLNQSPERNRSMYIAIYFCAINLIGGALANTVGGWVLDNPLFSLEQMNITLFGVFLNRYNYLFLLSFIIRLISVFILLPRMVGADEKQWE